MTQHLLGAHVSIAGGIPCAPRRGAQIGATAIQIFTKSPSQWRDPRVRPQDGAAFRAALAEHGIRAAVAHGSYLVNLASPDRPLRDRSVASFAAELRRCRTLGIRYLVVHPGNFIDDRQRGLARNAAGLEEALDSVHGPSVLLETTAGSGTALGATFEELAALRHMLPRRLRRRVAFCADTCHLWAAGYDLRGDWNGVWHAWDTVLGLGLLRCLHLNDSRYPRGARRDRHAPIGEGTLGAEPFRRVMRDSRFRGMIKIIETPKGQDGTLADRRMLRRLRAYGRPVRAKRR